MNKRPTEEQIALGKRCGWSDTALERGYFVADHGGSGMLEIQRVDEMGVFKNDAEAVKQAIRDGYQVIPAEELPEKFEYRYLGWLDTPGNRNAIIQYAAMRQTAPRQPTSPRGGFATIEVYLHCYKLEALQEALEESGLGDVEGLMQDKLIELYSEMVPIETQEQIRERIDMEPRQSLGFTEPTM